MIASSAAASLGREDLLACLANDRLHLVLCPTEACNFRCAYCYEDFGGGRMDASIVTGLKTLLSRRAPGLRTLTLSWFGGEPLLATDIIEDVMSHARGLAHAHPNLEVVSDATTNGYLLTRPIAERLIDLGLPRYQVSFDPPRERHDRLRVRSAGGGTFDRIWENLLALRASDRTFTVTIRIHADRRNAASVPRFLDACAAAFGADPRYEIFVRELSRLGGPNDADLPVLEPSEREAVLESLRWYANVMGLHTTVLGEEERICYAAKANSFVVRADGRLNKCTVSLDHPANQIGQLRPDGTVDVDARKLAVWVRGIWSASSVELACPKRGVAEPAREPAGNAARRPVPAPVLGAALLLLACGVALPGRAGPAPAPPAASAVADSNRREPNPTLEDVRRWNRIGEIARAEEGARSLLAEAERGATGDSAAIADVLDELAVALRRGGKSATPEARDVCERAVRLHERAFGRQDGRVAVSLYNLGLLQYMRSEFVPALETLREALEIRRSLFGGNDRWIAKCLIAMAVIQGDLDHLDEAVSLAEQGVAIEEIVFGRENPERVLGLNALASLRYSRGDYAGAIPLYQEAISLWERAPTPNTGELAACFHNLGAMYLEIDDTTPGIEMLERALRIRVEEYEENNIHVASTLTNLGDGYQRIGDRSRAGNAFRRAVRILEIVDPGGAQLAWALLKLGWYDLEGGDVAEAGETFERALRYQEASIGREHRDLWLTLRGLAHIAEHRGDPTAARAYFRRTVDIIEGSTGPRGPDMAATLADFAAFELGTGDSLSAFDLALRAADISREHFRLTVAGTTERQALIWTHDIDAGMDLAFAAASGSLGARAPDVAFRLWDALVRSRAMVLDEIGARARWVEGAGDLIESAKALEAARSRLASLLVRSRSSGEEPGGADAVRRAREEVDARERELASRSATFRAEVDRSAIGLDRVLGDLPHGSALISYVAYGRDRDRAYMAFVAGSDRSLHIVPLGPADAIEASIARWRRLLGTPPPPGARAAARAESECRAAGLDARRRIWDPHAGLLARAAHVFIVPDGSLDLINFAALPASPSGYLVESPYATHYFSTERDVVRSARVHSHGAGLLAIGNPSFDLPARPVFSDSDVVAVAPIPRPHVVQDDSYRDALARDAGFQSVRFTALAETGLEIEDISKRWGRSRGLILLEGERAGERALKDLLPGRRIAHIATHGFFLEGTDTAHSLTGSEPPRGGRGIGGIATLRPDPAPTRKDRPRTNPFRLAGLALAGANLRDRAGPDEEDGILIAEEIASLDLSSLDWVVLSACQTGVGEVMSGEGVFGLRRAFEIAGAGTLVMSLWSVEDRSTREWMNLLYEGRLIRMLETAEAVREADLGVLRSLRAQGRSTHPFYWAAFIATGDWR